MRKRPSAHPRLESLETRAVPSVVGPHPHVGQALAAHVAKLNTGAERAATAQTGKLDDASRHHHHVKHTLSSQHTEVVSSHHAQPQKQTSSISQFFKSLFSGL